MRRCITLIALLGVAGPAAAVGLGPLTKEGFTDGPAKAFYLTVINPYPRAERFNLSALQLNGEVAEARVTIFPSPVTVGGKGTRRVLVIARDLAPGETHTFRVCAERAPLPQETIHARVCSKLAARRLGAGR